MQERNRHGRKSSKHPQKAEQEGRAKQRAFCIAAGPDEADLSELNELLETAGVAVVGSATQRREKPHPNTYLGAGKLEEVAVEAKAADANVIVCDDELSPRQERNLEEALSIPVVDRTAVILDIFAGHAHSADGKLQVELAQLEYNLARMRGLWTHLERLGGGIGTRGPGESQIETDRRLARDRISALRRRLKAVGDSRQTMRSERERSNLPMFALAGYTNAGKSTLMAALTGADVEIRDRLFHTLDPTTRVMELGGRTVLATDTVGFIRKLPHQLVKAFGATLEETRRADLILHVVDASVSEDLMAEMLSTVESTLSEIGASDQPRLLVCNKIDLADSERLKQLHRLHPDAVCISAREGTGLDELRERIETVFLEELTSVELLLPFSAGAELAELHNLATRIEREDTPEGVKISAMLAQDDADRFARFAVVPSAGIG
ncbi:MAG: GTPase HflX [Actinobacteria bacterium]|uniref:Unannotated protein n=1 Tax=freshwater metagenome TaxID=449393 RepID=A0A6J5ZPB9_9ZZZZ|nr:GTPase HflX [Actinomycetota bacterium]